MLGYWPWIIVTPRVSGVLFRMERSVSIRIMSCDKLPEKNKLSKRSMPFCRMRSSSRLFSGIAEVLKSWQERRKSDKMGDLARPSWAEGELRLFNVRCKRWRSSSGVWAYGRSRLCKCASVKGIDCGKAPVQWQVESSDRDAGAAWEWKMSRRRRMMKWESNYLVNQPKSTSVAKY